MTIRLRRPRKHGSSATVSIHVRDLAQMLNSWDPSPFWDRDLDRDAAQFIEDEFADKSRAERWHLHIYSKIGGASIAADLRAAVVRYYSRLATSARLQLREQMRVAQIALIAGSAIFSLCVTLRGLLQAATQHLPRGVDEGLIVVAWIALWRPVEQMTYGWIPLYRKRKLYERLARVQVTVRGDAAGAHVMGEPVAVPTPQIVVP